MTGTDTLTWECKNGLTPLPTPANWVDREDNQYRSANSWAAPSDLISATKITDTGDSDFRAFQNTANFIACTIFTDDIPKINCKCKINCKLN